MLTGVAVVFGYALLGSTWLIMKTKGRCRTSRTCSPVRWSSSSSHSWGSSARGCRSSAVTSWRAGSRAVISFISPPFRMLALVNAVLLWRAVMRRAELRTVHSRADLFRARLHRARARHLAASLPPDLRSGTPPLRPRAQSFVLVGTLIMLPAVLGYTWWSYSVFRGKVVHDSGYY